MAEKIVIFGAGATGRGHIGLLAWQAGYQLVFVDKNCDLIEALKSNQHYLVRLYGTGRQEIDVSDFRVYHSDERELIAEEIVDAVLVLTAVFDQNLADVAITLALAISLCKKSNRTKHLNCIACENMMDSSSTLGNYVKGYLSEDELDYCEKFIGFPDCMISRVVPQPKPDPLIITTEDYNEWTVRKEAFKGEKPQALSAMELVENQTARLERKLFIHNGGHAVCGYVGYHRGHRFIHEAVKDPVVVEHVLGALNELGNIIELKHGFTHESIEIYKQDLLRRGQIAELRDEIHRVIRDPIRKLSPRERLVAPALQAEMHNLSRKWIVSAIVAALHYEDNNDPQAIMLADMLENRGLVSVLTEICKIDRNSLLLAEILEAWQTWSIKPSSLSVLQV